MILTIENCANTCYIIDREKKTTKTKENKKSEWKEKNKRTKERLKTKKDKKTEQKKGKQKNLQGKEKTVWSLQLLYSEQLMR